MFTQIIQHCHHKARSRQTRVVFPEGEDPRVCAAAAHLAEQELADPILLGNPKIIATHLGALKTPSKLDIIDLENNRRVDQFSQQFACLNPGRTPSTEFLRSPLFYGAMLLRQAEAEVLVAGATCPTAEVISAGIRVIGLAEGIERVSSFFLMLVPNFAGQQERAFIFADCAVNVDPSASELADIAISSAHSGRKLLATEPRIALLSFSSQGSANHPLAEKIAEATRLAKQRAPELLIDGELQADAALVQRVAHTKLTTPSEVAGAANVLVFPNLDAANIGYKLTQYMGNASAIGPFLQGLAKPVCDLSRGATVDDIVQSTAVTISMIE